MQGYLIKGATILSLDHQINGRQLDIIVKDGKIARIAENINSDKLSIIDGSDCLLSPGFIQTHIHLCQTLFRGLAEGLPLLPWLEKKIWRLEALHNEETIYDSAKLGIAEMLKSGVTTFMSMETVKNTEYVFQAALESGMRCFIGNALMNNAENDDYYSKSDNVLSECLRLISQFHRLNDGLVNYAFAPRFALSSSEEILQNIGSIAREKGLLIHSHSAENLEETQKVRGLFGCGNVEYFIKSGLAGKNLCLAHCIWLKDEEFEMLKEYGIGVLHCPGSNCKLGSGIADVVKMKDLGVKVSLGSDGAACNNTLDIFNEMRTAGYLQSIKNGAGSLSDREIFRMATIGGAECLGIDHITGSIEIGKSADLTLISVKNINNVPSLHSDVFTTLVYSCQASDVAMTMCAGKILYERGVFKSLNPDELVDRAEKSRKNILQRL